MSEKKTQLFVAKLPRNFRESDLMEEFRRFGKIMDVSVLRGFGFVVF